MGLRWELCCPWASGGRQTWTVLQMELGDSDIRAPMSPGATSAGEGVCQQGYHEHTGKRSGLRSWLLTSQLGKLLSVPEATDGVTVASPAMWR